MSPIDGVEAPNVFVLRSMEDAGAIPSWIRRRRPPRGVVVGAARKLKGRATAVLDILDTNDSFVYNTEYAVKI